jgi:hypothetical protein
MNTRDMFNSWLCQRGGSLFGHHPLPAEGDARSDQIRHLSGGVQLKLVSLAGQPARNRAVGCRCRGDVGAGLHVP